MPVEIPQETSRTAQSAANRRVRRVAAYHFGTRDRQNGDHARDVRTSGPRWRSFSFFSDRYRSRDCCRWRCSSPGSRPFTRFTSARSGLAVIYRYITRRVGRSALGNSGDDRRASASGRRRRSAVLGRLRGRDGDQYDHDIWSRFPRGRKLPSSAPATPLSCSGSFAPELPPRGSVRWSLKAFGRCYCASAIAT